jgi:hypothetical protein
MFRSRKILFGPVVLMGTYFLPSAVLAETPKVAVVDTVQASLKLKLSVRQAVAAALDELSVAMVPMEDLTQEDAACTEAPCYTEVAKRVEATHLFLVQGVANPAGYRLSLDIRDGKSGRSLGTDGKDCELCAEDQFATTVQERVKLLWTRVLDEQKLLEDQPAKKHVKEPKDNALAPVTGEQPDTDASAKPPWWKQRTPMMGLGFAAAGLVATGFGIYYVAVDGNTVESTQTGGKPIMLRDTGKWGWSLVSVGLISMAAGSAMIIWGREDGTNVSVTVGLNSLGLQGKF